MESDLQIIVKGVYEELATKIGNAVAYIIKKFDEELDFRRMHCIIITADFAGELKELSSKTLSGKPITFTNEKYAIAVAKVVLLPRGEEIEILPVINANIVAQLVQESSEENLDDESLLTNIHLLHHEFCHVHDDNKKLDALHPFMLRHCYSGKDILIGPLAEACWSEYMANLLSSSTVGKDFLAAMTQSFIDAIGRTKQDIDKEILSYRYHHDLERLINIFKRHGEYLIKSAAYILGYLDGLGKSLFEISVEAAEKLSGSYFEPIWKTMQESLRLMFQSYPEDWKDLSIFNNLAIVLENYYAEMGLILSTTENGQMYVNVPFRPETTPFLSKILSNYNNAV